MKSRDVPPLTYRGMERLVSFFICAHSSAVKKGVKRLFFTVPWQAPEPVRACSGVNAARLTFRESAGQAAATTRLLNQLAADRHWRAHGERLLVTRLARDIRAVAPG